MEALRPMQTPHDYAQAQTGLILTLPAGTRIGGRRLPATEAERTQPPRHWTGWEAIELKAPMRLEIQIDAAALQVVACRAARSTGRKAKQGPITLRVRR
jgi:hypothetical protein